MTLSELTRQDSGIVVHAGGGVMTVNWQSAGPPHENALPYVLSVTGEPLMMPHEGDVFESVESRHAADIRDELPGSVWMENGEPETDMDIIYDPHGVIGGLYLDEEEITAGAVYKLSNGTVIIAPEGWD